LSINNSQKVILAVVALLAIVILFDTFGADVTGNAAYGGASGCKSSRPCGAGMGDCDNDLECMPGLKCVDNVGSKYGFPKNSDVCESSGSTTTKVSAGNQVTCSLGVSCQIGNGEYMMTPKGKRIDVIRVESDGVLISVDNVQKKLGFKQREIMSDVIIDNALTYYHTSDSSQSYVNLVIYEPATVATVSNVNCIADNKCLLSLGQTGQVLGTSIKILNIQSDGTVQIATAGGLGGAGGYNIALGMSKKVGSLSIMNQQSSGNSATLVVSQAGTQASVSSGSVVCLKSNGMQGSCSSSVDSSGKCTCN